MAFQLRAASQEYRPKDEPSARSVGLGGRFPHHRQAHRLEKPLVTGLVSYPLSLSSAPPRKKRKRGLSLGSIMLSIAETMLAGGDLLCDLGFAA